jgi:hypothetical protein
MLITCRRALRVPVVLRVPVLSALALAVLGDHVDVHLQVEPKAEEGAASR